MGLLGARNDLMNENTNDIHGTQKGITGNGLEAKQKRNE
jgi:hypothetical protein